MKFSTAAFLVIGATYFNTLASGAAVFACPSSLFSCESSCIPKDWACDGDSDCPNGEDERPEICQKHQTDGLGLAPTEGTTREPLLLHRIETHQPSGTTTTTTTSSTALPHPSEKAPTHQTPALYTLDKGLLNNTKDSIKSILLNVLVFRSQLTLNTISKVVPELQEIKANMTQLVAEEREPAALEEKIQAMEESLGEVQRELASNINYIKNGNTLHNKVKAELTSMPVEVERILGSQIKEMSS